MRRHSWILNRLLVITSPHVHLANIWAKSSSLIPASKRYNKRRKSVSVSKVTSWRPADKDVWHRWKEPSLLVETIPHSQRTKRVWKSLPSKPGRYVECSRYKRPGVVGLICGEGGKNNVANSRASTKLCQYLNYFRATSHLPWYCFRSPSAYSKDLFTKFCRSGLSADRFDGWG